MEIPTQREDHAREAKWMKQGMWIVMLLAAVQLFGKSRKPQGYVLDAAALSKIQSYCIDTHNLPPTQVKVIEQFVSRESRPKGLLTRIRWRLVPNCQDAVPDAFVRVEFPFHSLPTPLNNHDIKAVLHVFRSGNPSPVYETEALPWNGLYSNFLNPGYTVADFQRNALDTVFRTLIHDLQQMR